MSGIDRRLLDSLERACHAFQRLTGRTCVWLTVQLTNLSSIVFLVWGGVYVWTRDLMPRSVFAALCSAFAYLLARTIFAVPVEAYEEDAYRRVAKGLRNPRRLHDAPLRLSFLTLSVVLLYPIAFVFVHLRLYAELLTYVLVVLTTVMLYLLACDPLGPQRGRLQEWLAGFRRGVPDLQSLDARKS